MDTHEDFWTEINQVSRRRRIRRTLGTVAALVAMGGAMGCSASGDPAVAADAQPAAPAAAPVGTDVEVTTPATPAAEADPQPSGGPSESPSDPETPPTPAGPAPTIDSFETPEDIDCHNGNFQEFTASWTTTGAERVTIAIDGPGIYAEYAADGETSLPFNCSSSHTFTLVAEGSDGQTASRQITLQPRNVQTDEPIDDLEAASDEAP